MYHECKLVHADLSEYNILYHDSHLYIIDVSQSVEHDHPHAFDFLRNDVKNIEGYFGRRGVTTLGLRRCFEFVTRERLGAGGETDLSDSEVLNNWLEVSPPDVPPATVGGAGHVDGAPAVELDAQQEDSVFFKSYIPRTLNEVYDPERDLEAVKKGGKTIYSGTIGVVNHKPEATTLLVDEEKDTIEKEKPKVHFSTGVELEDETHGTDVSDDEEGDGEGEDDQDEEGEGEGEPREKKPRGHRYEDKEAKKVGEPANTAFAWLTKLTAGTQKSREGGTTREAKGQDAQVGEEETDKGHCPQTMSWPDLACACRFFLNCWASHCFILAGWCTRYDYALISTPCSCFLPPCKTNTKGSRRADDRYMCGALLSSCMRFRRP